MILSGYQPMSEAVNKNNLVDVLKEADTLIVTVRGKETTYSGKDAEEVVSKYPPLGSVKEVPTKSARVITYKSEVEMKAKVKGGKALVKTDVEIVLR